MRAGSRLQQLDGLQRRVASALTGQNAAYSRPASVWRLCSANLRFELVRTSAKELQAPGRAWTFEAADPGAATTFVVSPIPRRVRPLRGLLRGPGPAHSRIAARRPPAPRRPPTTAAHRARTTRWGSSSIKAFARESRPSPRTAERSLVSRPRCVRALTPRADPAAWRPSQVQEGSRKLQGHRQRPLAGRRLGRGDLRQTRQLEARARRPTRGGDPARAAGEDSQGRVAGHG